MFTVSANNPGDYSQNVTTKVNVTNAYPRISSISMPSTVDLIPGSTKQVNCTIEAYDWNGASDMILVNATLWENQTASMSDADSNLTHYTIDNCTFGAIVAPYNRTFYCEFIVYYYANASNNWICNATVTDTYDFSTSDYNTTEILPLYALNVTSEIDFGEAAVGDIPNATANITNFGNQAINISVEGYGRTPGDQHAMDCDQIPGGYINITDLKFTPNPSDDWAASTSLDLNSNPLNISGLTVPKIDLISVQPNNFSTTYWHLFINPIQNPFGVCNGTVVFTAWNAN
ncbi:hypothetical protein C0585_07025 [Candidatus Woesearchaeota archaeon]|nr:MAG: hypothetical protein C0585_07025 [Candidatus Woesearchaeota archaeon]